MYIHSLRLIKTVPSNYNSGGQKFVHLVIKGQILIKLKIYNLIQGLLRFMTCLN